MSTISWISKAGTLGVIPENVFYTFTFSAIDSDEQDLFYSFISGRLPGGMYVTRDGRLQGSPILSNQNLKEEVFTFAIRATNPQGKVADRSFSLSVGNVTGPQILVTNTLLGAWFDGTYLNYQFQAANESTTGTLTWKLISGSIPPGTTFSSDGTISGYIEIIASESDQTGYENIPLESNIYDELPKSTDRYYNFTIQVFDGIKFDTQDVRLLVVSKSNFTADNQVTLINNTFITIDTDDKYRPIIINDPSGLPILVAGSTFAYKFVAFDPDYEDISWTIDELAFSGLDELDAPYTDLLFGDGTGGPYILSKVPDSPTRMIVIINGVKLTAYTDYTVVGTNLTLLTLTPSFTDLIEVQFISVTTGFDTLLFDQGESGLPSGLTVNENTGWVFGTLPAQVEDRKTYEFKITAFRTSNPTYRSDTVSFTLSTRRTINEEIIWTTPEDLGYVDNGSISELGVEAYHTLGKQLQFSIVFENYRKIPQGLKFLRSGRFTGRTTFRHFTLDGTSATLRVFSTADLEVGMQVQGPGVTSGCKIYNVLDSNTIEVRPAIYVNQGTLLTFTNEYITKISSTISNSVSTAIDGNNTTFDQQSRFTVKAEAEDGTISSIKTFIVTIRPYNLSPYENVYLKSLPSEDQRILYQEIINNENIFPPSLIYRADDPNFGVSKSFKFLFLSGLSPSTASNFVNAINKNHYNKTINFGDLKTAIAKNDEGEVVYEVVYVDALDTQAYNTDGVGIEKILNISNGYLINNEESKTIFPNSFKNMQSRIENTIGYTNRGALPKWMTSVQENGLVLGLTRAIVLAYVKPGSSKLIKYRLQQNLKSSSANFSFVADRYQWDNYLSINYDTTTASFNPSKETTFDKYTNEVDSGDTLNTYIVNEVIDSNIIQVPDDLKLGIGWILDSIDTTSTIPDNTIVSGVNGNLVTISSSINSASGAQIRIIGETKVDYAVTVSFNSIDGVLLSTVKSNYSIDGVTNFLKNENIIFRIQEGFNEEYDGWVTRNGSVVPGYLDYISGTSQVNQRGGAWTLSWNDLPENGFDNDIEGFDQRTPGFSVSRFDQGQDSEVTLTFRNEVLFNQSVYVRTGKSTPQSILIYTSTESSAVPTYTIYNKAVRTAETTFDGGTCCVREKDIAAGRKGVRGGTNFYTNRDKYVKPESKDKYIKFPQTGVFV